MEISRADPIDGSRIPGTVDSAKSALAVVIKVAKLSRLRIIAVKYTEADTPTQGWRTVPSFRIRAREPFDDPEWLRMRQELWPDASAAHQIDIAAWVARPDAVVLVAEREDGLRLAGFAEVGSRPFADGCETSPVAYLEGWYVDADVRRQGVGSALLRGAEAWARERGYREFASDALLENEVSHRAHQALGFSEVERAVRYRKSL